jgi:CRISPR-associated protein (TIGR02584 family)
MKQPCEFKKRVLLAVSGMSPQILTETLYALCVDNGQSAFIPTEVHLITTLEGSQRARLQLLHAETGKFQHFCRDYKFSSIQFNENHIHVIADDAGNELNDIVTPEQNEAAADFICNKVRELTLDEDSALHVSLAGGRKTMGYYMGYALSLFGREQDRLSHVLVTDQYEGLHDFFYPTLKSRIIYDRNNKPLDTQRAEVMLAEIPFVRLRSGLPQPLLEGKARFNQSIQFARLFEAEPKLDISYRERCLYANTIKIELSYVNFAFYLWMIEQTVKNAEPVQRPHSVEPNSAYAQSFIDIYQRFHPNMNDDDKTIRLLGKGMDSTWLSERISDVRSAFRNTLGANAAQKYAVQSLGGNNNKTYLLPLEMEHICVI